MLRTARRDIDAVAVAEHDEPPAIIGSYLQRLAYPDDYKQHVARGRELQEAYHHAGNVLDVQLRGEYLVRGAREGRVPRLRRGEHRQQGIFRAADDGAGFSAGPAALRENEIRDGRCEPFDAGDRSGAHAATRKMKSSPSIRCMRFLYVADKYEGLVVVGDPNPKSKTPGVSTLLDGDPRNNFLKRAAGVQSGRHSQRRAADHDCRNVRIHAVRSRAGGGGSGQSACSRAWWREIGAPELNDPQGIAIQFRYAFVVDRDGLKVLDVTDARSSARWCPMHWCAWGRAQYLRGAHVCIRCWRQAGAGDCERGKARTAQARSDVFRGRKDRMMCAT